MICDKVFRDVAGEESEIYVAECFVRIMCVEEIIGCIDRVKEAVSIRFGIEC